MSNQYRVRLMTAEDLELVFSWRNHPNIRCNMFNQDEISFDEHVSWFEKASKDNNRHLLLFEIDFVPLGFINIHSFTKSKIADWGFYVAPNAAKGTAIHLGNTALKFLFDSLSLHKICGQVLAYNVRSIRFHQRLKFKQEGILRQQYFDGEKYHDLICFGLLTNEWQAYNW